MRRVRTALPPILRSGAAALAFLAALATATADAADTPPSTALPDLSAIRAEIYSGDYATAIEELTALTATVKHADLYNLLGYANRKLGHFDDSRRWYAEALYYDPMHLPALEYQGELFIAVGDLRRAEANIGTLDLLCPKGCAELDTLKAAVAAAKKGS